MTDELRLICMDSDAPPLFSKANDAGEREGYEPAAAALVADALGRELRWVFRPWGEFVPSLNAGDGDAIWCGQGITDARKELVDFTRPYAVFDESVVVRAGEGITRADDLNGKRVGAIAGSTNMALAETFDGAERVPFDGSSDDVFGEMVAALRGREVDAVVDDDVALIPLAEDEDLSIAFTVPTRNAWGVSVAKDRPKWRDELDAALGTVIQDGRLEQAWRRWMPTLEFPL